MRAATAWRFGYLAIQGGSGALAFVVLARVLDARQLGIAATALALTVTVQVLADFGLSQVTTSQLPRATALGSDGEAIASYLATLFLRSAALAFAVVGLAALVVDDSVRSAVLLTAPAAGSALLISGAESISRAKGDPRRPVVLATLNRLTFFPLALAFGSGLEAWQAMAIYSFAACLGGALALHDLHRLRRATLTRSQGRGLLRAAFLLGIAGVLVALATRANVLVLSVAGDLVDVGRYEAAWRAFQPLVYVAGALGTAAAPYAARALATGGSLRPVVLRGLLLSLSAGVLGSLAFLIGGPLLMAIFYGSEDPRAVLVTKWLGSALPMALVALYLQAAILVPSGEGRLLVRAAVVMFLVTIVGTALVAPHDGAVGTAIVFSVSQYLYVALLVPTSVKLLTHADPDAAS